MYLSVELGIQTDIENLFYRSFGNNLPLPLPVFYNDRHPSACKIERNFIDFGIGILQMFQIQLSYMREDCLIHQVSQAGLKITVEVRVTKNTFTVVIAAVCIDILLQHNFIASQCAGFISTKYIHCSKILNGIEVLYDCFLFGHGDCSFRQVSRHNHR